MKLESEGTYPRNTMDIEAGLQILSTNSTPDAIVMIGTYQVSQMTFFFFFLDAAS